jgi:SAM-dependent methyltransferase
MSSERYTHGHHPSVLASHTWRTIANSAAYLEPSLEPGLSLLDVGCGPGTITAEFAERLAPGRVVGLDAAPEVIDRARSEFALETLELVVGDAYALPFDDDAFDIVHAHQTLQHVADPVAMLREMRRVARPGGIVAVRDVDYAGTFWYPLAPGLDAWLDLYERVHRSNGGEPDAGRRLAVWARQAGFTDVTPMASIWCFATEPDRQWWGGMWERRILESAFATQAVDRGFATRADLEAISRAWRSWAVDEDGWLAMPHGELILRA